MTDQYKELAYNFSKETAVCDYVAEMTDSYAINTFEEVFIPKGWNG